ncbi:MAG: DUF4159 domain-containing protein [Opitutus sp.]|nr:DUF4159 domain-containing protein [Opitutus sp.]
MVSRGRVFLWGALAVAGGALDAADPSHQPRRSRDLDESGSLISTEGSGVIDEDTVRTARETVSHSTGTPNWTNPRGFEKDVFTFARVIFKSGATAGMRNGFGRRLGWWVDYPDADLNFSYRLQQMTSTRVDPDARVIKLSDPELFDFPLLYMEHTGYMQLRPPEVEALRKHLQTGGALLVNDFWSTEEWVGFALQMKRVLPGREWVELDVDHPLFHCVFDIRGPMKSLQVPTIQFWNPGYNPRDPESRLQRMYRGEGSEDMHVRALLDDKQRIMVVAIHNSDISDGWEREGENSQYFQQFSEKIAYPLGINLIFYLMTH